MRIKSELLWGDSIRDKSNLCDLLQMGKLPYGYYLLLCTKEGRLEIISSGMINNNYDLSKDGVVLFGIAHGKNEAFSMMKDIMNQIYVENKYASVKEYAEAVLEEPIC